ncbi:UrcA family protein [Erythrobacter sp.]|uniref:UrcA family protein n=1 Tax=Erythrobacter sp. TaxID=1042 RepID=UPI001425C74F|nr:UrcA family protein [Erythrobacter sp.]QIQ87455.1 MAG: UrcA family protein [Erythrobacter sp.]
MKTFAIAAAAFGLAVTATPAFAGGIEERNTMQVSLAGLDLDTPEGQEMLDQRIERAARDVCQLDRMRTGTRLQSNAAKECYAKAKASAKQQVAAMLENQRRGG